MGVRALQVPVPQINCKQIEMVLVDFQNCIAPAICHYPFRSLHISQDIAGCVFSCHRLLNASHFGLLGLFGLSGPHPILDGKHLPFVRVSECLTSGCEIVNVNGCTDLMFQVLPWLSLIQGTWIAWKCLSLKEHKKSLRNSLKLFFLVVG